MRTPLALAVFFFPLLTLQPAVYASDYLGAKAVLRQVDAQTAAAGDSAKNPGPALP